MNDFDYDALQKKRLARSDRCRKRSTRKCTLPSDYLTPTERKRRNGEMKTYNLSKPMTYAEFLAMPDDLQAQYLRSLRWRFGASDKRIAQMMGVSHPVIKKHRDRLGIRIAPGTRLPQTDLNKEEWTEWVNGGQVSMTPLAEQPEDASETDADPEGKQDPPKTERAPVPQQTPMVTGGSFTATGSAGATAQMLAHLFEGDPREVTFTLTFAYTEVSR